MFLFEDQDYLSPTTSGALEADGVSFYSFPEFEAFVSRLGVALTGIVAASRAAESAKLPHKTSSEKKLAERAKEFLEWSAHVMPASRDLEETWRRSLLTGLDLMGPHERKSE